MSILPSYVHYYETFEWDALLSDFDDEVDYQSEYYTYLDKTKPPTIDDRKLTKLWTKAFRQHEIHYVYVPPIKLSDRVKRWNVPPDNFLTRLETLANCNKLTKQEVLPIVREYRKHRFWGKNHASRLGHLLKRIKDKKNEGRYTIRYLEYYLSPKRSKALQKKIDSFQRIFYGKFPFERVGEIKCTIERKHELISEYGVWNTPLVHYLYIGPIQVMRRIDTRPDGNIYKFMEVHEQFSYRLNAHGEAYDLNS